MLFEEEDAALLKKWIIKRLEDISDADSDVLADYVLALLRHDQTQEEVQKLCIEQLDDFLHDHTAQFVKDVFVTLKNQGFMGVNSTLTGASQPQQPQHQQQQQQHLQPQNPQSLITPGVSHSSLVVAGSVVDNRGTEIRGIKRERSHFERDREGSSGQDTYSPSMGSARGYKAPRRGGGAPSGPGRWNGGNGNGGGGHAGGGPGRGGIGGGSGYGHPQGSVEIPFVPPGGPPVPPAIPQFGMPPIPPPGFPWAIPGPGDPMGAYLAAQAAAVAWGGFPPIGPPAVGKGEEKKAIEKVGERCKDYDEKGFCMKGDMCPYEHGMDRYVVPTEASAADEYDPNNSQLFSADTPTQNNHSNNNNNRAHGDNRGRGRGRGNRGGGGGGGGGGNRGARSEFSGTGPSYDRSNTTLVVEHIPDDKLEESAIRAFFSEFGTVLKVDVIADKRLATVKFERWDMARKAYDSPAPIFDNRFVKVFWYKPNAEQNGTTTAPVVKHKEPSPVADEMEIDMEEFKKKQEEAQKAHEAKMLKKKANEEAAKELERRKEELQRMQLEEKRKLEEKLAKKRARSAAASASPPASGTSPAAGGISKTDAQAATTAALEAQLRALQAEAESLGIEGGDTVPEYGSYRGRSRGRFPFRGRGGYAPRGRGVYVPVYGSYGGRGAFPTARGRGGTLKLDNRTRKITVSAADLRGGKDEEFRHYLMNTGLEVEGIEPHPDKDDTQIVTFKDRRTAEKFIYTGNDIPNVGEVTLAWFNAPPPNPSPSKSEDPSRMDTEENGTSAASSSAIHHHHINSNDHGDDDVYEDDEGRWLPDE